MGPARKGVGCTPVGFVIRSPEMGPIAHEKTREAIVQQQTARLVCNPLVTQKPTNLLDQIKKALDFTEEFWRARRDSNS